MKFAITFATLFLPAVFAFAKPVAAPLPRMIGISHHEFQGLSRESQLAYMKDMRNFVSALAKNGVEVTSFWDDYVPSEKWAFLQALLSTAQAGQCDGLKFYVNPVGKKVCVFQYGKVSCDEDHMSTAAATCTNEYKAFRANPTYTQTLWQSWRGNPGTALNEQERKELDTRFTGLDAKINKTPPIVEPAETKVPPPVLQPQQPQQPVNPPKPEPPKAEIPKDEPANMRCIYAGFAIPGGPDAKCEGLSSWKSADKRTFECPLTRMRKTKIEDPEYKTLAKETILCNPVLFGVDKQDEPFCVNKGKDATEKCLKKSKDKKDEAMERAVDLAKKNKDAFERMRKTVNYLCTGKENDTADVYIRDTLKLSDGSRQDLKDTCEKYKDALSSYHPDAANPSARTYQR